MKKKHNGQRSSINRWFIIYPIYFVSIAMSLFFIPYLNNAPSIDAKAQSNKCDSIAAQANELKRKVENDQQAIRYLGFEAREQDFQEWEELSEDGKAEMKRIVLDSLLTLTLNGALLKIAKLKPISRAKTEGWIRSMNSLGFTDPFLQDAVRGLAVSRKQLPRRKEKWRKFIGDLTKFKDTAMLGTGKYSREDLTFMLEATATVLSFALEDSKKYSKYSTLLGVTLSGESLAYNLVRKDVAEENIDRLTRLTEEELRSLTKLSKLLQEHVGELNRTRLRLDDCDKEAEAERARRAEAERARRAEAERAREAEAERARRTEAERARRTEAERAREAEHYERYSECMDRCYDEFIRCYNRALPGPVEHCANNVQRCYDGCKKLKD